MKDTSCEKHLDIREYSNTQVFLDNLPYIVMVFLGAIVLVNGINSSFWRWTSAGAFILYGIVGALWIIVFVCPYCHYYDTRLCPCGYGRIAARLRSKNDGSLFTRKFKRNIPVIFPLWFAPVVAGVVFLVTNFSLWMLTLIALFAVDSFVILPLLSIRYGCAHCPQRAGCPWMRRSG